MDRYLLQPFRFGQPGGAAVTEDADRHLRDRVIAVLFTRPGERINEPDFGVGLDRSLFEGIDELTLGALRFRITEGLRRGLGDDIAIDDLEIRSDPVNGELYITLEYHRRIDGETRVLGVRL